MKQILLAVCLACMAVREVSATPQYPDKISYTGVVYRLDTPEPNEQLPLNALWKDAQSRPPITQGPGGLMTSACYRGYVAHWAVEENTLFLTGIDTWLKDEKAELQTLFPDRIQDGKVKADWFSGTLTLWSQHGGPDNVQVVLTFEKGKRVKGTEP